MRVCEHVSVRNQYEMSEFWPVQMAIIFRSIWHMFWYVWSVFGTVWYMFRWETSRKHQNLARSKKSS